MFQNSLYDVLPIRSPYKGMHEDVEHITPEQSQGMASYVQNLLLSDSNLKLRYGTKEILSFLRKDQDENILPYSPKMIKIRDMQFYQDKAIFLYLEKRTEWCPIQRKEDAENNTIKITLHNINEEREAALERGILEVSLVHIDDEGQEVVYIERISDFKKLDTDTDEVIVTLHPIPKNEYHKTFYTADNIKEVRYISGALEVLEHKDNKLSLKETECLNLGVRGIPSFAFNSEYMVFATGCDPIVVIKLSDLSFQQPKCYIKRDGRRGEIALDKSKFPVLQNVMFFNSKFFGIDVDKKFKTSLNIAYTKEINNPLNWFEDASSEGDASSKAHLTLDLSAMHGCQDSLIKIMSYDNYMIFIGKKKTQVWSKGTFTIDTSNPDKIRTEAIDHSEGRVTETDSYKVHLENLTAKWDKTFDIGALSSGCITKTDMGIFFISTGGVRVIAYDDNKVKSRLKIFSISGVDKILKKYFNNEKERVPASFSYSAGGIFGFRFGGTCVVGHIQNNAFLGWSVFTGSFSADNFTLDFNEKLIMFRDQFGSYPSISVYDDGRNLTQDFYQIQYHNPEHKNTGSYADQIWVNKENADDYSIEDSTIDIEFTIPVDMGRKFGCKYLSIVADYFTTMNLDPENRVEFVVGSDLPNVSYTNTDLDALPVHFNNNDIHYTNTDISAPPVSGSKRALFRWMGDQFYTLKIDQSRMSETGSAPLVERCKFVGQRFKVGLIGSLKYTEFVFKKVELYGIIEK